MSFLSPIDLRILDDWQRDLPLTERPFATMAAALECDEETLLADLARLRAAGTMARVGATCRPNTVGVSTLAALAVPEWRIEEVAQIVGAEPGVNHSYLREHHWNIWFVATAADADELAAMLARIETQSGLRVLKLPLKRAFNVDLGFRMAGPRHALSLDQPADTSVLQPADRKLLQRLTEGLPLVSEPFAALGAELGLGAQEVIARIKALLAARIITRIGVIVRHRALGWRSNAMVVWKLPDARIAAAGQALVRQPGVTLCYERHGTPDWDHTLFCMVHAKSRAEAAGVIADAAALPELSGAERQVLFSVRCFKQTGAQIDHRPARTPEAAE